MPDYSKLRCPICKETLAMGKDFYCEKCKKSYPMRNEIPIMLASLEQIDKEQDLKVEKDFYENMFSNLKGLEDGHCIVYGYDQIYEVMDKIDRGSLIEVGCGTGHHSVHLKKMGFDVTSVDLSINALTAARKLAEHESKDILFLCGDIKRLPFADKSFDVCFCSLILHHFMSLENLICELSRVTRKCFVAFEVNALEPVTFFRFNIINPIFGIRNISKNQRALFPEKLKTLLMNNGFGDVKITYESVHDYLGKEPKSFKARMILMFQKMMRLFPEKYSRNKFFLVAKK